MRRVLGPVSAVLAVPAVLACGAFLDTNPATGRSEKVTPVHDGHDYEIEWSEQMNGAWGTPVRLSSNSDEDLCPHLAFDGSGGTAVVWARQEGSLGRIYYRGRDASGAWQAAPVSVSDHLYDASTPWVAVFEGRVWIAWHETDGPDTRIVVAGGDGSSIWPTGFTLELLATTTFSGPAAVEAHAKEGHLWIVWVDDASNLGYSEYDAGSNDWGGTLYEPYSGAADLQAARARVEARVIGN